MFTKMLSTTFSAKFSAVVIPIAALAITLAPGVALAHSSATRLAISLEDSALSPLEVSSVRVSAPTASTVEVSSAQVSGPAASAAAYRCVVASGTGPLQLCTVGASASR
jgi:hypothetical protein